MLAPGPPRNLQTRRCWQSSALEFEVEGAELVAAEVAAPAAQAEDLQEEAEAEAASAEWAVDSAAPWVPRLELEPAEPEELVDAASLQQQWRLRLP
mmetsp:Transcript_21636/g.38215  ORF Transcript_21636/g.38215 Transcript_21636/m.38215 type:complete len:96 (+) Transcript_21636:647-934(+)